MAERILSLSILNLVAHPHPKGVYSNLLMLAAKHSVGFYGSEHAAISAPTEVEPGIFQGRVAIWAKIDTDEPGIDLNRLEEIDLDQIDLHLPENIGFNGRIFLYTLEEGRHFLFVEARNEFGKNLAPSRARRIFERLLSPEVLGVNAPLVDVTVVPDDDSLGSLFSVPHLDSLHIRLVRPNGEEFGDIVNKYLGEMEAEGAGIHEEVLRRSPQSPTLKPSKRTKELASVASYHGYVEVTGKEDDGEKFEGSTREHPKIIRQALDGATSFAVAARRIARDFIPPFG